MSTKRFLPVFLILSACASSSEVKPTAGNADWINHPEASYPPERYLVSVGQGGSRDEAINDAKKQMAESFVVKVNSYTKVNSQSNLNQDTSGGMSGDSKQNVAKDVSLESNTYLRGAEVKEVSQSGSQTYALVALDKLKARSGLLLEANRIQSKLNGELDSLEQHYTREKYIQAKTDLDSFQQLYGEAAALGMSALVDLNTAQGRLQRIEDASRNKNQKISFSVKTIKGEDYFERDIESCINDRGGAIYTLDQSKPDTNKIEISVIERPQHLPIEGFTKIRFDLTASVTQPDGKLYRIQTTQTETGRSRSAVLESVSDKLSKDLCDQLFNRMGEM